MKNRSILFSLILCLSFSSAVTLYRPAQAQVRIPAPVVTAPTLATMAGLYALAYYAKGWVKTLSEDNVAYMSDVPKLDEYNGLKSLAKMEDRGFWAIASFALYDLILLCGYPVATAQAVTIAFNAGLTGLLMFGDVPARFTKWHETFNARAGMGPLDPACGHEQPKNSTADNALPRELTSLPGQQAIMIAWNLIRDVAMMYIGYQIGLSAYKSGKAIASTAVTAFVPDFTEDGIYQASEYLKVTFIMQKMMGKFIESYVPALAHDSVIKPFVLMHPDQEQEHYDASFYAGLFSEIFMYVPMEDHKKLWHQIWG